MENDMKKSPDRKSQSGEALSKNYIAKVSSLSDYDKKRTSPIPVKIKIAFAAATSYRALPLKGYAAHISENTVIA